MSPRWKQLTIPCAVGEAPQADPLALSSSYALRVENWRYTREGGLWPRPGFQADPASFAEQVVSLPVGTVTDADINTISSTPIDLYPALTPQGPRPLLATAGSAFVRGDDRWEKAGYLMPARLKDVGSYGMLGDTLATCLAVGDTHGLVRVSTGAVTGRSDDYRIVELATGISIGTITPTALTDSQAIQVHGLNFFGRPAITYIYNNGGTYTVTLAVLKTTLDGFNEYEIATDPVTVTDQLQAVWATTDGTDVYIAHILSTSISVKISKVASDGSVSSTVTYTHPTAGMSINGVSLAYVGTSLVLAMSENAGATRGVRTAVFSTALVDQAIDVAIAPATGATAKSVYGPVVGPGLINGSTVAVVAFYASTSTLGTDFETDRALTISRRSTSNNTAAVTMKVLRSWGSLGSGIHKPFVTFRTWLAPWVDNTYSRTYIGITQNNDGYATPTADRNNATWFILDITESLGSGSSEPCYITAASEPGSVRAPVFPVTGGATFLEENYVTYNSDDGGSQATSRVKILSLGERIGYTTSHGVTAFGGGLVKEWDGNLIYEAGWYGVPRATAVAGNGGALSVDTFAVQVVWAWTDGRGRIHRSPPSVIVSDTTAGANLLLTVTYTQPQVSQRLLKKAWIEIYCSLPGYNEGDSLYLVKTIGLTPNAAVGTTTITADPTGTEEILYTVGGVLPNFPPPQGDAGLATVGRRTWVASGLRVVGSKLFEERVAPGWSDSVSADLPAEAGRAVALVADRGALYALCDRGVLLLGVEGPDNTMDGPSVAEPVVIARVGCAGPRAWTTLPSGGVLFQSDTGGFYLISGNQVQRLRAMQESDVNAADPAILGGTQFLDDSPCLAFYDERAAETVVLSSSAIVRWGPPPGNEGGGRWHHWILEGMTAISACHTPMEEGGLRATWVLATDDETGDFRIGYMDEEISTDNGEDFPCSWISAHLHPGEGPSAVEWSRVREVTATGRVLLDDGGLSSGTMDITVDLDDMTTGTSTQTESRAVVRNETGAADAKWPTPRFVATLSLNRQKASLVRVSISIYPAIASLDTVELLVKPVAVKAPGRNR